MNSRIQRQFEQLALTPEFKQRVFSAMASNPNFGNGSRSGSRKLAERCASELEDYLEAEIQAVKSKNFVRRMSGQYYTKVVFGKDGWVVELWFNRSAADSPSLRPDKYGPVYLPALFNNGWSANGRVVGYWEKHDMVVKSRQTREATRFVENAVKNFNEKWAGTGIVAEYESEWYGPFATEYMSEDID